MEFINKDIFKAFEDREFNILCHQENCEGLSRFAGIAKIIHNKWSGLTEYHKSFCKNNKAFGNILLYKLNSNKFICNFYSQVYRGSPKKFNDKHENRLIALKKCCIQINNTFKETDLIIGMPLIASGLASDKSLKCNKTDLEYFKENIYPIIKENIKDVKIKIYYI